MTIESCCHTTTRRKITLNVLNLIKSPEVFSLEPAGARIQTSIEATNQIDALIKSLVRSASSGGDDLDLLVKGIGARVSQLNGVIMSALSDDGETEADLCARLAGV